MSDEPCSDLKKAADEAHERLLAAEVEYHRLADPLRTPPGTALVLSKEEADIVITKLGRAAETVNAERDAWLKLVERWLVCCYGPFRQQ